MPFELKHIQKKSKQNINNLLSEQINFHENLYEVLQDQVLLHEIDIDNAKKELVSNEPKEAIYNPLRTKQNIKEEITYLQEQLKHFSNERQKEGTKLTRLKQLKTNETCNCIIISTATSKAEIKTLVNVIRKELAAELAKNSPQEQPSAREVFLQGLQEACESAEAIIDNGNVKENYSIPILDSEKQEIQALLARTKVEVENYYPDKYKQAPSPAEKYAVFLKAVESHDAIGNRFIQHLMDSAALINPKSTLKLINDIYASYPTDQMNASNFLRIELHWLVNFKSTIEQLVTKEMQIPLDGKKILKKLSNHTKEMILQIKKPNTTSFAFKQFINHLCLKLKIETPFKATAVIEQQIESFNKFKTQLQNEKSQVSQDENINQTLDHAIPRSMRRGNS